MFARCLNNIWKSNPLLIYLLNRHEINHQECFRHKINPTGKIFATESKISSQSHSYWIDFVTIINIPVVWVCGKIIPVHCFCHEIIHAHWFHDKIIPADWFHHNITRSCDWFHEIIFRPYITNQWMVFCNSDLILYRRLS